VKLVLYHPEASAELAAAADRYESVSLGLGAAFVDEVAALVARIEEFPGQFPVWRGNPRFSKGGPPGDVPLCRVFPRAGRLHPHSGRRSRRPQAGVLGASPVSPFPLASSTIDHTLSSGRPEQRRLRPYQEGVVRDFLTFADEAWTRSTVRYGRIVLPPRTGKTAIAACIARELQLPATFLVPTKTLVEQTAREVEAGWESR
jgi:hypothetical protein